MRIVEDELRKLLPDEGKVLILQEDLENHYNEPIEVAYLPKHLTLEDCQKMFFEIERKENAD